MDDWDNFWISTLWTTCILISTTSSASSMQIDFQFHFSFDLYPSLIPHPFVSYFQLLNSCNFFHISTFLLLLPGFSLPIQCCQLSHQIIIVGNTVWKGSLEVLIRFFSISYFLQSVIWFLHKRWKKPSTEQLQHHMTALYTYILPTYIPNIYGFIYYFINSACAFTKFLRPN